ncbi:MAG: hypothetical protein HC830_09670, partial [Bacteroidetes bacterium]|nr:hypothetical protein [Bacteroidota bacterium]
LPNTDLLKLLISLIEKCAVTFYKVKAHQKSTGHENPNREADMLCRKILRERLKSNRNNKLFPEK